MKDAEKMIQKLREGLTKLVKQHRDKKDLESGEIKDNQMGDGLKSEQTPVLSEQEEKQAALVNSIRAYIDEKSDDFKSYVDTRLDELENK